MGIINDQIKNAFVKFEESGNLSDLTMKLVCDADFSVRYAWQFAEVRDALRKHCPKPVFECIYYDGEHGEYHLFDFDPNIISRESLLIEVRARLQSECHIDLNGVDKAMQSVYLLNTIALVRIAGWKDIKMEITKEHLAKIKAGLKGLYNLSPNSIEPYFSACSCDCCGSELAGDRYETTASRGKKHTDPKEVLSICVDCYLYLFS